MQTPHTQGSLVSRPVRRVLLAAAWTTALASGCAEPVEGESAEAMHDEDSLEVLDQALYGGGTFAALWPNGVVPVCFDSPTGFPDFRARVPWLLHDAWSKAAHITFNGFGACPSGTPVVRIKFEGEDERSYSNGWGRPSSGSRVLHVSRWWRFDFDLLHEMGHALGFAHEQERPDNWVGSTPIQCGPQNGDDPDYYKPKKGGVYYTAAYDTESIMNYCTKHVPWLSKSDVSGVRVAYGERAVYHEWQVTPRGAWTSPTGFNRPNGSPVEIGPAYALASTTNDNGTVELFHIGADGNIWHSYQRTPGGGWDGPQLLTRVEGGAQAIASVLNKNGLIQVFFADKDGIISHLRQTTPAGAWGSVVELAGAREGWALAAAKNGGTTDGALELFFIGSDGQIWHVWETVAGAENSWSDAKPLNVGTAHQLAAAVNKNGIIELFHIGPDNQLWHEYQTSPGGSWTGAYPMGFGAAYAVAAASNDNGTLEVFHLAGDGVVWHEWQTYPQGPWTGGIRLYNPACANSATGCPGPHDIAAARNLSGAIEVFNN